MSALSTARILASLSLRPRVGSALEATQSVELARPIDDALYAGQQFASEINSDEECQRIIGWPLAAGHKRGGKALTSLSDKVEL